VIRKAVIKYASEPVLDAYLQWGYGGRFEALARQLAVGHLITYS
jgi:hypothetical protein